ncbi:unnamed protein product, partial [Medioppia subpectinata]
MFETLAMIGKGGYGQVMKVSHKTTGDVFAIKKCQLRVLTAKQRENVLKETENLIKLRSEYVIQYYYSWIQYNCLYIQMELCFNGLIHLIKTQRKLFKMYKTYDYYISYDIFKQLVESVEYLHKNNIIHRDLKPDNVLISMPYIYTNHRYIKLCDFGLSKEVKALSDEYNQRSAKHTADIAQYMAPEAQFGTDYNHLIDVYSLALIGAELFHFDSDYIRDGVIQTIKTNDKELDNKLSEIYGLLLSMSVSIYTESYRKIDWRLRPECDLINNLVLDDTFYIAKQGRNNENCTIIKYIINEPDKGKFYN